MDSSLVEAMLRLLEVYERRRDLQRTFPEVTSGDYRRLLDWARGVVQKRWEDGDYELLRIHGKRFESLLSVDDISDPVIDNWLHYFSERVPVGSVSFGSLRRVRPISRDKSGWDRGLPIDRYYIEQFLSAHSSDIRGRVLEIEDGRYTHKFGEDRVTKSDILHAVEGNPNATIVADLSRADHIPSETFDCIIITQTLQCIYDVSAALKHIYRILKLRGTLLATFPGISHISRYDMDRWGDYWRFTTLSARLLFEEVFGRDDFTVEAYGNVLAAIAFLHGLAKEDLQGEELDCRDPDYEVTIAVRAVKAGSQGNLQQHNRSRTDYLG